MAKGPPVAPPGQAKDPPGLAVGQGPGGVLRCVHRRLATEPCERCARRLVDGVITGGMADGTWTHG